MPQKKQPKPKTPPAEMTTEEKILEWRRKRSERGSLQKPKGGKKDSK